MTICLLSGEYDMSRNTLVPCCNRKDIHVNTLVADNKHIPVPVLTLKLSFENFTV